MSVSLCTTTLTSYSDSSRCPSSVLHWGTHTCSWEIHLASHYQPAKIKRFWLLCQHRWLFRGFLVMYIKIISWHISISYYQLQVYFLNIFTTFTKKKGTSLNLWIFNPNLLMCFYLFLFESFLTAFFFATIFIYSSSNHSIS